MFPSFLTGYHRAFSLEEGERGETDLVHMEINTGDAYPRKQRMRRMPFALRQEVARQLRSMQENGVIQPSKSPWASPVVLVRKRDGSHRLCVDYRSLNAVTKRDNFPLPRIDDLLDVLGQSKYFSTIDLASGFWQIQLHPNSQEKNHRAFMSSESCPSVSQMHQPYSNASCNKLSPASTQSKGLILPRCTLTTYWFSLCSCERLEQPLQQGSLQPVQLPEHAL